MGRTIQYGTRKGSPSFCLGPTSHLVPPEEVLCWHCGALVKGAQFGVYEVEQLIGQGRGGAAYLAVHHRARQSVVLKLLPSDPINRDLWESARREILLVTALCHPSILTVFSCVPWSLPETRSPQPGNLLGATRGGTYLLTLQRFAPETLTNFLAHLEGSADKEGTQALSHLLHLIQQMGSALSTAHAHGIVHGALTPNNILLDERHHLWIADFGLARLRPPPPPYLAPELYPAVEASLQQGALTPFWEAVTPEADQYLFATLCQQLCRRLLQGKDYESIQPILHRAASKTPTRRFASCEVFVQELVEASTHGHTISEFWPQPELHSERSRSSAMEEYRLAMTDLSPEVLDWEKRGNQLFLEQEYDAARDAYQKALEIHEKRAVVWLALGDTSIALENYEEALIAYNQAMALNPDDPLVWSNKGTALDALGRHQEAIDCYERADQLRQI
ncbi:MAG TPA: protein kinase family protein [Ktedonosporobacter sp.]|nr:protein kinase family protein [Ktedonosporobacter sp.]